MSDSSLSAPSRRGRPRNFDRNNALMAALGIFWRRGSELTSVGELCKVMDINPPSLYAAFGNKASLFLEAVDYYETTYWDHTWKKLQTDGDIYDAIEAFFTQAACTLTCQAAPCGCLVVLAAVNVLPESTEVYNATRALRDRGKKHFTARLHKAVADGQLPGDTPIEAIALTLTTLLEGMSIPAQDGISKQELTSIAGLAVKLLPARTAE